MSWLYNNTYLYLTDSTLQIQSFLHTMLYFINIMDSTSSATNNQSTFDSQSLQNPDIIYSCGTLRPHIGQILLETTQLEQSGFPS